MFNIVPCSLCLLVSSVPVSAGPIGIRVANNRFGSCSSVRLVLLGCLYHAALRRGDVRELA